MMLYRVKDPARLKQLLWIDAGMGSSTGIAGFLLTDMLKVVFGLPALFLHIISLITLAYAVFAIILASARDTPANAVMFLVLANWLWAFISIWFLLVYADAATTLGIVFLILQIVVVGGLAYLEGRQLRRT